MGDVLADYGLLRPSEASSLLRDWDQLFARFKPAAIVADFAPASLVAARGRIPAISIGNGYTLPPPHADRFALLADGSEAPKHNEVSVLAAVNDALAEMGRTPLRRYPEVFTADRTCVACFDELDPFLSERREPNAAPFLPEACRPSSHEGTEIFAYFIEAAGNHATILSALANVARAGVPIRMHIANLPREVADSLQRTGVIVEASAVPFEKIVERSAMILSHGGVGLTSSALVAGIPHVVVPLDLEKRFNGHTIERLGFGRCFRVGQTNPLEPVLLAAAIRETFSDQSLRQRSREAAPAFAARLKIRPEEVIADYVDELT
jgi:rhamnosyltransferase subunit B